jgi:hypothetical protein
MIFPDDKWVKICDFDSEGEICFTKEYLDLTSELGCGARRFAAHLITHWDDDFQSMLDYFGSDDEEEDKYSGIDGEPMDVREDVTDLWEYYGKPYDGLEGEWYRDVLRSKLVTLQLPERIIKEYVKIANKSILKR